MPRITSMVTKPGRIISQGRGSSRNRRPAGRRALLRPAELSVGDAGGFPWGVVVIRSPLGKLHRVQGG
jgi:hypothetical protein